MSGGKVSVILTTFNGRSRGYLAEAIESVLAQNYRNFDLLIVDDGSSDGTREYCSRYLDGAKVRYLSQENKGLAAARNAGILNTDGQYVCFLDDDDAWHREKLARQVDFLESHPDPKIGMVFTWLDLVDEKGAIVGSQGHHEGGDIYRSLFFGNTVDAPSSVLIKREVFETSGLHDEAFKAKQDYELWFRIARHFTIYPLKERLVRYRMHHNKISNRFHATIKYAEAALDKALSQATVPVDRDDVFGNYYLSCCRNFLQINDPRACRHYLFKGARLAPKRLRPRHLRILIGSILGRTPVRVGGAPSTHQDADMQSGARTKEGSAQTEPTRPPGAEHAR